MAEFIPGNIHFLHERLIEAQTSLLELAIEDYGILQGPLIVDLNYEYEGRRFEFPNLNLKVSVIKFIDEDFNLLDYAYELGAELDEEVKKQIETENQTGLEYGDIENEGGIVGKVTFH